MNTLKLYEINALLQDAYDEQLRQAEANDGIVPDDWDMFVEDIQMERVDKILDTGRYYKNLLATAEAIKAEKMALDRRQKSLTSYAERVKASLSRYIKIGEKISDANTRVSWRKSQAVEVDNIFAVPEKYVKIERTPMKKEIKEAIAAGEEIAGARLENKINLTIQ